MRKTGVLRKSFSIILSTILVFSILCLFPGEIEKVEAACSSGIKNNGLAGISINVNAAPYTTFAGYSYGQYAYGTEGCAWFASARVNQLTGRGNVIRAGTNWYRNAQSLGYGVGQKIMAPSIACWNGHVAIVEKIDGDVAYISEGGNRYYSDNVHGYTVIRSLNKNSVSGQNSGFLGYVYLPGATEETASSTLSVAPAKGTFSSNEDIVINWSSQTGAVKYGLTVRNSANQDVWDNYVTGNSRNIGRLAPGSYSVLMMAYNSSGKGFGGVKRASFSVSGGSNPRICVDRVSGDAGCIYISGWSFDPDDSGRSLDVHVYIGGPAGTQGAECHIIKANVSRQDVNSAYGISGNHGFATYIPTQKRGTQSVYAYAINCGGGNDNTCGGEKSANISGYSQKISAKRKSDGKGYTITLELSYMPGVTRIQFPTWTENNGQDDLLRGWETDAKVSGKRTGNTYTFDVNALDHNGEYGLYRTHIYAVYGDGTENMMFIKIGELDFTFSAPSTTTAQDANNSESSSSNDSGTSTSSSVKKPKQTTKKITVSKTSVKVKKGKTATVKIKVTPSTKVTKEKIKISCNNKNIKYSFDKKTGKLKIKGKKKGTSKIKIKAGKKSKTIKVKVTK